MTTISLDTLAGEHLADVALWRRSREGDPCQHRRLSTQLHLARQQELTERQRQMLTLYYDRGSSMRQIARQLGVNPSTVCRTLQRARGRLFRTLRYCL